MGYTAIAIFDEWGKQVEITRSLHSQRTIEKLVYFPVAASGLIERINIRGLNESLHAAYSTWRELKLVPTKSDYLIISENTTLDLTSKAIFKGLYENRNKRGLGWKEFGKKLRIGDGIGYENNVDSTMSFFLYTKGFRVTFDAVYDTETGFDFLQAGYIQNGVITHLLKTQSTEYEDSSNGVTGNGTVQESFDLPSGYIELFVRFVSDEEHRSLGATINSITIGTK